MAESYITQSYSWSTGDTITASRLNGNVTNLTSGLSDGDKAVNVLKVLGASQQFMTADGSNITLQNIDTYSGKDTITVHKPENDGNPQLILGAATAERLEVNTVFDSGAQTLDYVQFQTKAASATADKGEFRFLVDETAIADINDSGLNLKTGLDFLINDTSVLNETTLGASIINSSLTSVGTLTSLGITGDLTVDTDTLYVDSTNDRVGIGTTTPLNRALHIKSTAPGIAFEESGVAADNSKWDILANVEQLTMRAVDDAYAVAANFMQVDRTGTTIDSVVFPNGNVGIGTASPQTLLELSSADPILSWYETGVTADNGRWDILASGENIEFRAVNDAYSIANQYIKVTRTGTTIDEVIFPNGNVGIGTDSPGGTLDIRLASDRGIRASGVSSGVAYLTSYQGAASDNLREIGIEGTTIGLYTGASTGTSSTQRLHIDSAGNVGIGTYSPSYKLEISSNSDHLNIVDADGATDAKNWLTLGQANKMVFAVANDALSASETWMEVERSGATVTYISFPNGNVGIGTDSPNSILDVEGNIECTGGIDAGDSGTYIKRKVVEIGDWDMDADASVNVAHGVADFRKIRSVSVMIRGDGTTRLDPLNGYNDSSTINGYIITINSTNVNLGRTTGGFFDSSVFDSTSYNRGWVTIEYEV